MANLVDLRFEPEVSGGPHLIDGAAQASRINKSLYLTFKRVFDIVAVLASIPFVMPLVLLFALLVKLDGGDVFFSQQRVGRNGRTFKCWKLRTMVPDAENKLQDYLSKDPAAKAEWDEFQKLRNDPRITRIGGFLRKSSADELPQLWNILVGDMSLVGPRPMLPSQRALYPGVAYYDMRPGLTGFWQISDRNKCSFAGRASFDTLYARQMSFWTDMKVLLKTVSVVINGTGI